MFLHDAIIQLITKLRNSNLITDRNNYTKFKSHLDLIVTAARGLSRDWKSSIIEQLEREGLAPDSRGDDLFHRQERIAAARISKGAALDIASIAKLKVRAGKARGKARGNVKAKAEVDHELNTALDDMFTDDDGGARKRRKRRKTKRRKNKKLKKTYKKRRSTKNKRR